MKRVALALMIPAMLLAQRRPATIRTEVEMVVVNARVADAQGRAVIGLKIDDFQVYEDKVRQKIEALWVEQVPATIGIVFDVSKSMDPDFPVGERSTIREAARATSDFLQAFTSRDEFFLIRFNDLVSLDVDFTNDIRPLQQMVAGYTASGRTRLWDAVVAGVQKAKLGRNARKAVIVVSDGDNNSSDLSEKGLAPFMREQYVQVYYLNTNLVGQVQPERNKLDAQKIAAALKNQYLLGYRSTNETPRDGKWHDIRVKVRTPAAMAPFTVAARPGYFAPK